VNALPIGSVPLIALANAIWLTLGSLASADEIEAPPAPPSVLLSSELPLSPPPGEDRFSPSLGVRKGRGFQVVQPIEMNDRKYEFYLSGPLVKSGSKKKSLGLSFEFRF
jgi:hypothetical protein